MISMLGNGWLILARRRSRVGLDNGSMLQQLPSTEVEVKQYSVTLHYFRVRLLYQCFFEYSMHSLMPILVALRHLLQSFEQRTKCKTNLETMHNLLTTHRTVCFDF
jgi:hypothetical protein